ncbi:MAG: hypothetical protein JXR75_00850 [Rhodobacteraceae bacterium]|nr:hypothetical protein [Paracoccaceae bacterium]
MDRVSKIAARLGSPRHVQRFVKEEDGYIVVFTVVIFTLMLAFAGFGLDIIQFETTRTKLQQTSDRATLAAASLTQKKDAKLLVEDYFDKAGLGDSLKSVVTEKLLNSSVVSTEAQIVLTPTFMNLWDLENKLKLTANAKSRAEQRINNIEIVLVLDVSGSMVRDRYNNPLPKLANLKTAASEFIDTVLAQDTENRVSIAIVPYNGQVNLPEYLQQAFTNRIGDHGVANVNCFDLPPETYSSLGLPADTELPVTAHADTRSDRYSAAPNPGNRWCPPSTKNVIRAPTNDGAALKAHINGLEGNGATSINAGLKWGLALLDPSSASLIDTMVGAGQTPSNFSNRPFAYNAREAMKIVVLMTDGEHFEEERMNADYRTGISNIWYDSASKRYSVYHDKSGDKDYFYPHTGYWYTAPSGSGAVQQTWPQVWEKLRVSYVAYNMWVRPLGGTLNSRWNMFRSKTPVATMNAQLQQVCDAAHAKDVIVYGIAFEAPTNGQTAIANCASSPAHYFNAAGLEITTAFRSIATNISQLKLTQ